MRHLNDHRKLGRTTPHRRALLCNMATSLIRCDRIETTLPKAKELRRIADRLVTWGKRGSVTARRQANRWVKDRAVLTKLFGELANRFKDRVGGYTRIFHLNPRLGDCAPRALIEYLPGNGIAVPAPKKKAKKK